MQLPYKGTEPVDEEALVLVATAATLVLLDVALLVGTAATVVWTVLVALMVEVVVGVALLVLTGVDELAMTLTALPWVMDTL